MFDRTYELYAKYSAFRWLYQLGFLIAWAIWVRDSLKVDPHDATWLVFGWLPAVFWPVQLAAFVLSRLCTYCSVLSGLCGLPG
jgi:hypothetical protein